MLRCRIVNNNDDVWYDIAEGAVFTENYNETLDSGTIIIQHLPDEIRIEPYDTVIIESYGEGPSINTRRMCVDTVTCNQVSIKPALYNYEISLFSETKVLEGVICPNLSITKLLGSAPRDIVYYLNKYLDLYSPRKTYTEEGVSTSDIKLSQRTINKFNNIQCPEMQWNQPTLREVLNDLMMTQNCIPVLNGNSLEYIDIGSVGDEISDDQKESFNYITGSHSSADYVSDIKMHLVNAANNATAADNSDTRIVERIGFRNNESYLLTTENMRLQTNFPIWRIFSCIAYFSISITIVFKIRGQTQNTTENVDGFHRDLTNYILEHSEWLTKDVYYGAWQSGAVNLSTEYRNTCLYFTRGVPGIYNFNQKAENSLLFITESTYVFDAIVHSPAMDAAVEAYARNWCREREIESGVAIEYESSEYTVTNFRDMTFELSYEAIDDCVFAASKIPAPRNKRQIVDNQTNSYIDVNVQGMFEYIKAKRLGNQMIHGNARFVSNEADIPGFSYLIPAPKLNGKIIFQRQISVYSYHIDANYQAVDNYVMQNYFTGVKSKLRSWRVVSGSEALVRADLLKFYVNGNIESVDGSYSRIPSYNSLQEYLDNFKFCAARFNNDKPRSTEYRGTTYPTNAIQLEFTKHVVGKSVVFTIKMQDNFYAGNYVSDYHGNVSWLAPDGRVEQKGVGYTDADGEVYLMDICFYSKCTPNAFGNDEADRALKPMVSADTDIGETSGLNLNGEDMVFRYAFRILKDNKEIPQISIQFELNEDANDMFLGRK